MNNLRNYIGILTLLVISCNSPKQTINEFDKLLSKKWKLVSYEQGGKTFDSPDSFQTNRMDFHLDHTVESSGQEKPSIGDWQYDVNLKTITIVDKMTKETILIKVKSLSDDEFVVQIGDTNERVLTLHMKPDTE